MIHQSFTSLPKRVVLDVNVLLNACFVSDSSARDAISQLGTLGYSLVIDSAIELEALKMLNRFRIKNALAYDPAKIFQSYLKSENVLILPTARFINNSRINRADRHVFSAGKAYTAWVLTGDIKFMAECQSQELASRLPYDVLIEAALVQKRDLPPESVFRFAGVSKDQGSIFARVIPGRWAGVTKPGLYTIYSIENAMSISYDANQLAWCLSIKGASTGCISQAITDEGQWTISGSYRFSPPTGKGNATLRVHSPCGITSTSSFEIKRRNVADKPGRFSLHWDGFVQSIVTSPRAINSGTWKALVNNPGSTPDPAAGNVVEAALRKIVVLPYSISLPTDAEIREEWI